jgi:phage shock protein PspC (stress-responsive transcriptional regulator)
MLMVQQTHRLHKSRDDRFLFGVAGGIAEYFDVDPVLVRVGWVLLTVATGGIGLLVYIVLAIVTPESRHQVSRTETISDDSSEQSESAVDVDTDERPSRRHTARNVLAVGLIVVGMIILLNNLGVFGSIRWDIVWPVAVVVLGLTILVPSIRR